MRDGTKAVLKRLFASAGYEVHRRDLSHSACRAAAMKRCGIDAVLDVGANAGQYVGWLREYGYSGRVVSIEPIEHVFAEMQRRLASDKNWTGIRAAVGAVEGDLDLLVSESTSLTSALPATPALRAGIPTVTPTARITAPLTTVDVLVEQQNLLSAPLLLKLDVQGFEHAVLDGAEATLGRLAMIEVEMALVPLYESGSTIHDLLPRLHDLGFEVVSIGKGGFTDATTGQVFDIDVLMTRRR